MASRKRDPARQDARSPAAQLTSRARGARWVLRAARAGLAAGAISSAIVSTAAATPAAQLEASHPQIFRSGDLAAAAAAGQEGARIVRAGDRAAALGLEVGDVVLHADGAAPADAPRFVVWRFVPGERPVLAAAVLGRQSIEEFASLPAAERTPMRLAVMLANRATLVRDGAGIVAVPQPAAADDAGWRAFAAAMPPASEAALHEVVRAMNERIVALAPAPDELAAARARLASRDYLEAEERARRAFLAVVAEPARRGDHAAFTAAFATWAEARAGAAAHQAKLLAREPIFGLLVESRTGSVQALRPQHTLLEVDRSTSQGFAAGVRIGWPFGDVRVVDDLSLVVQYGFFRNEWRGPRSGTDATPADILDTTVQEVNFELLYRPRVASRLKPYLRAGAGIHRIDADIHCDGTTYPVFERTAPGFLFGGGIDVWRWERARTRVSVGGAYRLLTYEFLQERAPDIEPCRNTLLDLELNVRGRDDLYRFEMSGWQVGLVVAFEP